MVQLNPEDYGMTLPTNTGENPTDLDELVLLKNKATIPAFESRDSVPKATWCLKRHGSLYLPVKKYKCGSQLNDASSS